MRENTVSILLIIPPLDLYGRQTIVIYNSTSIENNLCEQRSINNTHNNNMSYVDSLTPTIAHS